MIDPTPMLTARQSRNPSRGRHQSLRSPGRRRLRHRWYSSVDVQDNNNDHVLFRRCPESQPQLSYVSCGFLNETRVLAADATGAVDILSTSGQPSLLAAGVHTTPMLASSPNAQSIGLVSLDSGNGNGDIFGVGLPNGELRLMCSERSGNCLWSQSFQKHLPSSPLGAASSLLRNNDTASSSPMLLALEQNIYRWMPPVRRYRRSQRCSLYQQWQDPQSSMHRATRVLEEIPNYNQVAAPQQSRQTPEASGHRTGTATHWDFLSSTPQVLQATYIHPQADAVLHLVWDIRQRKPPVHRLVLPTSSASDSVVVAACLLDQNHLAIATSRSTNGEKYRKNTAVQVYDQRYASGRSTVSFPRVPVFCNSDDKNNCSKDPNVSVRWSARDCHTLHEMTRLPSSSSSLLLTYSRTSGEVVHDIWNVHGSTGGSGSHHYPLVETSDVECRRRAICDHTLASYEQGQIWMYDWHQRQRSVAIAASKKRRRDVSSTDDRRPLATRLTDRYGLETDLSCLAWNDTSTCLVAGSNDGDLFAWRI